MRLHWQLSVFLLFLLISTNAVAQQWELVGVPGFSLGSTEMLDIEIVDESPFIVYMEDDFADRITGMKYVNGKWELAGGRYAIEGNISYRFNLFTDGEFAYLPILAGSDGLFKCVDSLWQRQNWTGGYFDNVRGWDFEYLNGKFINGGLRKGRNGFKYYHNNYVYQTDGKNEIQIGQKFPLGKDAEFVYHNLHADGQDIFATTIKVGPINDVKCYQLVNNTWIDLGLISDSLPVDWVYHVVIKNTPYVLYTANGKAFVKKYVDRNWEKVPLGIVNQTNICRPILHNMDSVLFLANSGGNHLNGANIESKAMVYRYDGENWIPLGATGISKGRSYSISLTSDDTYLYAAFSDYENGKKATVKRIKFEDYWRERDYCHLKADFDEEMSCLHDYVIFDDLSSDLFYDVTDWTWAFGDGDTVRGEQNPIHYYTEEGIYDVTLVVENNRHQKCRDTLTRQHKVIVKPSVRIDVEGDLCEQGWVRLIARSRDSLFFWEDSSRVKSRVIYDFDKFWLSSKNECGENSDTLNLSEKTCKCNVQVPNSFTPNNDGLNDQFGVKSDCEFVDFSIQIFNRWGDVVYQSEDASFQWYGENLQPGTYNYRIRYSYDLNGTINDENISGLVNILY